VDWQFTPELVYQKDPTDLFVICKGMIFRGLVKVNKHTSHVQTVPIHIFTQPVMPINVFLVKNPSPTMIARLEELQRKDYQRQLAKYEIELEVGLILLLFSD